MNKPAIINFILNNSDYTLEKAFPNSKPVDGYYDDNGIQGEWEFYYNNGKLSTKGTYKDDKPDGYFELYHKNGELESKGNYKDNKRDGVWEEYYENGNLRYKGTYKDGIQVN